MLLSYNLYIAFTSRRLWEYGKFRGPAQAGSGSILECALRETVSVPKASRFLGAGAVDQHNGIARQQQ
jgi:hypothetical protein